MTGFWAVLRHLLATQRVILAKIPLFLEKADPLLAVKSNSLENFQMTPKLSVQTTYLIPGSKTLLGILVFEIGPRATLFSLLATQRGILAIIPLFLERADPLLAAISSLLENFQLTPKFSVQTMYLTPGSKTLLGILVFEISWRATLRPLLATQRGLLAKIHRLLEKADPLLAAISSSLENFHLTPKLSVQTTYLNPGSKTLMGILIFKIGSRATLRPLLATQRGLLA